jgi:hypothetical protein
MQGNISCNCSKFKTNRLLPSRNLKEAQSNYATKERELLAAFETLKNFGLPCWVNRFLSTRVIRIQLARPLTAMAQYVLALSSHRIWPDLRCVKGEHDAAADMLSHFQLEPSRKGACVELVQKVRQSEN